VQLSACVATELLAITTGLIGIASDYNASDYL
jgi:hypothetical protein